MSGLSVLVLVVIANFSPVLAARVCGDRFSRPVDGGVCLANGSPLLGRSKTWRGLLAAALLTPVVALLMGLPVALGLGVALAAMAGDLLSSFIKRRLGMQASSRAVGLDQLPESLLPLLFGYWQLGYSGWVVLAGVLLFTLGNMAISPLLFRLGIRRKPY